MRLATFLTACLTMSVCVADPGVKPKRSDSTASLQGVWFGSSYHAQRIVLVVFDDRLLFIHPMGALESSFTVNRDAELQEIDIDRYDGMTQLGVFCEDGATLTMTLADPEMKRPTGKTVEKAAGVPHCTVTFTRQVTQTGLRTLQVNMERHPSLDLTKLIPETTEDGSK